MYLSETEARGRAVDSDVTFPKAGEHAWCPSLKIWPAVGPDTWSRVLKVASGSVSQVRLLRDERV